MKRVLLLALFLGSQPASAMFHPQCGFSQLLSCHLEFPKMPSTREEVVKSMGDGMKFEYERILATPFESIRTLSPEQLSSYYLDPIIKRLFHYPELLPVAKERFQQEHRFSYKNLFASIYYMASDQDQEIVAHLRNVGTTPEEFRTLDETRREYQNKSDGLSRVIGSSSPITPPQKAMYQMATRFLHSL